MRADFAKEYSKLNNEQKQAINYIEGPLLVIAGPGTGKTQLLSVRAANILSKTDVLADNILCLTFSESGAQEMRSRLIEIIGEEAYKVTISTYHSFGSEIIRRNPQFFRGSFNLRPINDLKADTIIRSLQKKLAYTSELKSSELVPYITKLISEAKQSLLTPADLEEISLDNLAFIKLASEVTKPLTTELKRASMKSIDSFSKLIINSSKSSLLNTKVEPLRSIWNNELAEAIDSAKELNKAHSLSLWKSKFLARDNNDLLLAKGQKVNERLKEFAALYAEYLKQLKKSSLYDYDDMILMSINALEKYDELRFNLQEKYLYIMLDEYQDTNQAQAKLVELLTNNQALEGKPNVMALGDDDQAIFAFQGAKHSNMLDFTRQYKDVKQITLKNNYRSKQSIIDLSSQVGGQINERLSLLLNGVSKDFKAVNKGPGKITNLNFENEIEQYAWLTKELKANTEGTTAIIAPEHKYLERASAYLTSEGIDISYERKENILDDKLTDQIITILRLLKAINDQDHKLVDALLAIVLNYDFWGLDTEIVWRLSWRAHDEHKPWLNIMLDQPKTKTLALSLIKLAANSLIYRYDFIIDQVLGLSDIVISGAKSQSSRSPFIKYLEQADDKLLTFRLFQNLMVIREQLRDFNLDNNRPLMISDLIDFIDQLKSSNVKLTNNFNYGSADTKVRLMSAHGSKGLEFDNIYILSLINEVWGPKSIGQNRLSLPSSLEYIRQGAENTDDEKLRLLYVTLTRSKNKIVTLSYDQDSSGKLTTPLKYLDLATASKKQTIKTDLLPLWYKDDRPPEIKTDLKNLLKKRLETYSLSPTDLNTFIDIRNAGPANFYKKVLLKYSSPMPPRVDYGSAIHESLKWLQDKLSTTSKLPNVNKLTAEFEKLLLNHRLPAEDYGHLKEQGIKALSAYYKSAAPSFSKADLSEYDFRNEAESIGKVRISGKIDKLVIDKSAKNITIIDYKTGKGYKTWEKQPRLHLNLNQLYFYKLLVEKSKAFKGYQVIGAALDFIEPDKFSGSIFNLPLTYDPIQTDRLIKLIEAIWRHLEELSFPSVADYPPSHSGIIKFEDDLIAGNI